MCLGRTNKIDGFTLAELLVTIAIIGILFAIALPAFTSISSRSKLDGAARSVKAALKMAQQHARSKQQPTYLLIQDDISTSDTETAYRSYAVFTIDIQNNPITQNSGSFLLNWETLPNGIVFDNRPTERNANILQDSDDYWNGGFNHNRQLRIGGTSFIAIGFKPNGKRTRTRDCEINLTEGIYNSDQLVTRSNSRLSIQLDDSGACRINEIVN